jgi:thymidine phosphorylase
MATLESSRELADSIVRVASGAGVKTTALITDMNQVLGHSAGHTTEMQEAIDYLTGKRRDLRLRSSHASLGGGNADRRRPVRNAHEPQAKIEPRCPRAALRRAFGRMVAALGGPADLLEHCQQILTAAPVAKACMAVTPGRSRHRHACHWLWR